MTPGTGGAMTWSGIPRTVRTTTATTDGNTSSTHPPGDTTQDGLGYGTDTARTTTWTLVNSETPGSGGEWTETFTSTTIKTGLSTVTMTISTFTNHPTGELKDGTGTGLDMTTIMMATATTSLSIPGTGGATTWSGTLPT